MPADNLHSPQRDQALAVVAEDFPPFWRRLFLSLVREGFNEAQALEILKTLITAQFKANP